MFSFENEHASFFKIFFSDFSSKLRIPIQFVKKYGEMLSEVSLLETEAGKSWDVKIKPLNEQFYLTDGWPEFVKDNQLSEMDFLVFHLVSKSTFQVAVYGMDGCPKEPSSPSSENLRNPCQGQNSQRCGKHAARLGKFQPKGENCESIAELSGIRSFPAVVKKHDRYFMAIPKAFAMETGITRKSAINLQNVQGKEWRVEIVIKKHDGRICMTKGWRRFREANNLVVGTKFWFEFDATSGNLILKREMETVKMSSAKRGRGRPPKSSIIPAKRGRGRPPKSLANC
ncbi:hypothetical protein Pfo_008747 [Paulownia fortunei]|nr:hypothetical protein Pfo_008747 [Paulownia fortunei]